MWIGFIVFGSVVFGNLIGQTEDFTGGVSLFNVSVEHDVEFLFETFGGFSGEEGAETFGELEFVLDFETGGQVVKGISEVIALVDSSDK